MMPSNAQRRERPSFNEKGLTQWYWRVLHRENLRLGENTEIGSFSVIDAQEGVDIGDDVKIGFGCHILSYSSIDHKAGKVQLKSGCKIGSNTVVMPNTIVGENAMVGANSFVNRDVPANEIWVGTPIKYLKDVDENDVSR
jgi:acetyltransferase-like isoleucine patch superfamily enzyme